MKSAPLVSIGISTYNRADSYLRPALTSALEQTYPNLEIIVSDNCSADGTEELVKGLGDPRIRYFRQERNIGPINNFNFCLARARGTYFQLLHDDDLIDPDFVESCMSAVGSGPDVGIVLTGARVIDAAGKTLSERPNRLVDPDPEALIVGWIRGKTSLFLCSTLFHTERLKESGGFQSPRGLFPDVAATLKLSMAGRADVADVKAGFRRHGANHGTAARIGDWADDSLFIIDLMCELAPRRSAMIRREGTFKLCRQNYIRAQRVPGPVNRWLAYWTNYRKFEYRFSPLSYLLRQERHRAGRRLARIQELLSS
jgi:glycosyltransferase involved in cell wall biosynthesis